MTASASSFSAQELASGATALLVLLLAGLLLRMRSRHGRQAAECGRERRMREELEAYARVDIGMIAAQGGGLDRVEAAKALAKRVCRVIADKSAFSRVGVMLRDAEGRLYCAGSVGVDDLTVKALDAWGKRVVEEERGLPVTPSNPGPAAVRSGSKSFAIALGEWNRFDPEVAEWAMAGKRERRRWRRALVAPVRLSSGHMAGAVVVCADGPRGGVPKRYDEGLERAMGPIEALAGRLAGSMENETLGERLLRAEKLAGLGQLAGGVAHALNNPLTAVLGFAELIIEASEVPRIRQDAETIRAEALKMRGTVERLIEFWRPAAPADDDVDLISVVQKLVEQYREQSHERTINLFIEAGDTIPALRGSRERIRQMLEHLLKNAAQAIAVAQERAARNAGSPLCSHEEPEGDHSIRIAVSDDGRMLRIVVSDTGTGFAEPGRIFDPFYTTKGPEAGAGMGLSLCYSIVREHGGEISACNLYPRGAAVIVELPISRVVQGPAEVILDEEPAPALPSRAVPKDYRSPTLASPQYGFEAM